MALLKGARNQRMAGTPSGAKARRRQAQRLPSRDPNAPHCRRLWYVRYADDWRLGFSGLREAADTLRGQLSEFLRETLHLTLSPTNTLITTARTAAARFLGYEIVNQHADDKQHRALQRRCINGAPGLQVPVDVIRAPCAKSLRHGNPIHLAPRLHETDDSIVTPSQAEYRGCVQYYLLAYNVHRLWQGHRGMQVSLVKTLAPQHKPSVHRVSHKYQTTVPTAHGTLKALEGRHARGQGKTPLVARFGGLELRGHQTALLDDQPQEVSGTRSDVVQRLLAQICELCGATARCAVHPLRKLADLRRPGQREKPPWVKRMAARRRKTLVVCQRCHEAIHRERPSRRKMTA